MNLKNKLWKYVTAVVVVLIILNPEMVELALFIDAVGLEMFQMLLELQVLAILGALLNNNIKSAISWLKHSMEKHRLVASMMVIRERAVGQVWSVPGETALMHLLVVCGLGGSVFGMRL